MGENNLRTTVEQADCSYLWRHCGDEEDSLRSGSRRATSEYVEGERNHNVG